MPKKTIQDALNSHVGELLTIPGVVGAAIGETDRELCIRVYLSEDSAALRSQIPETIEGFPVVGLYTGEIDAL